MTETNSNPNKTTIFTTPLWGYDFNQHNDVKTTFIETIDSYEEKNSIAPNELSANSIRTVHNLHHNPVFRPLIDQILEICSDLKSDFYLEDNIGLGISSMYATKTDPNGVQSLPELHNSLIQGFYFLDTPKDSGLLQIYNPCSESSYFSFKVSENSSFNQELYNTLMPESAIIVLPSHLKVNMTVNKSDQTRRIIHFCICTV